MSLARVMFGDDVYTIKTLRKYPMSKPHPHANLMALYAQDATQSETPWRGWEYLDNSGEWTVCTGSPQWRAGCSYRRRPRTIDINGFQVPEPMREEPLRGEKYYVALTGDAEAYEALWNLRENPSRWLSQGLCHATRSAAELHRKALLSFTAL